MRFLNTAILITCLSALLCGWVDCAGEDSFVADLKLMKIL